MLLQLVAKTESAEKSFGLRLLRDMFARCSDIKSEWLIFYVFKELGLHFHKNDCTVNLLINVNIFIFNI